MALDLDVVRFQRAGLGHDLGCDFLADAERHRRGQARGHDDAALARQLHAHQSGFLLEDQPVARHGAAIALPGARQHEGGADIGMAGERHLGLGREDADLGRGRGIPGRQHEGRLGEVELGGDGLHALRRRPCALVTTASGLPPKARSVKTSTVAKSSFMARTLAAGPRWPERD